MPLAGDLKATRYGIVMSSKKIKTTSENSQQILKVVSGMNIGQGTLYLKQLLLRARPHLNNFKNSFLLGVTEIFFVDNQS